MARDMRNAMLSILGPVLVLAGAGVIGLWFWHEPLQGLFALAMYAMALLACR